MGIVSLRIWQRHHSQPSDERILPRPDLSMVPLAYFIRTIVPYRPAVVLHLQAAPGTTTTETMVIDTPRPSRPTARSWSVPGREAPDPAPVDPVLPAPDPAALRGPVAALRDCVARAAAQEEQGAGVRLIRFQAFVFDDLSQVFRQHRPLPHRVDARLGT